jgi:3-hydroxy-9,10-secoandrosta-1,3,5(10)-triene-9,17-dione monooxygenase reductase component
VVHYGDPWADPEESRDPVRRARGRMPAPVTIWTTGSGAGDMAGITVSSVLVAGGEPGYLAGLIGPESDFADAVVETGRFVVHLLADDARHRRLAQHFAGGLPAPEDQLAVVATPGGPALKAAPDRLLCGVEGSRPLGWSLLIEARIEEVELGPAQPALAWQRGRFARLTPVAG